jgi:ABC-type transport system involved in multi-copper enzyme maturation permease subunit
MNRVQDNLEKLTRKLNRRRLSGWLELEFASVYQTPVIEGIVLTLVFIGFFGATLTAQYMVVPISIHQPVSSIIDLLEQAFLQSYVTSINLASQLAILLVPLLISRSLARGFEDGTLVTYLSYPVSRSFIIGLKIGLPLVIAGLCVPFISLCADLMLIPTGANIYDLLIITGAFLFYILLIATSTALVAILSRSSTSTTFIGAGMWYALLLLQPMYTMLPYAPRGIINPVQIVVEYLTTPVLGPTIMDLAIAFTGSLFLSLSMIVLILTLFKRREVRS